MIVSMLLSQADSTCMYARNFPPSGCVARSGYSRRTFIIPAHTRVYFPRLLQDYFRAVRQEVTQKPSMLPVVQGDFFTYADKDQEVRARGLGVGSTLPRVLGLHACS